MDLNRLPEDGDHGSPVQPDSDVFCSICLDPVNRNVERTVVQLKCNHKFHLDCIGSAFNAKMEMECPNCRNLELGDWLFPSGHVPDADDHRNSEEILHVEMIEPNRLQEMAISIHWCPFEDVAPSAIHFNERSIAASSYAHAQVHRWSGPSAAGEIQAHEPTTEYTSHSIMAQQIDWVRPRFSLTVGGGRNIREEPISNSAPPSIHPFLSPPGVPPYDRGGQPPTRNFIDLVGPGTETGLHNSSINMCPFSPTSTEQGRQTRRSYWQ